MAKGEIPPNKELNKETIEKVENYNPDDLELGEDISVENIEMAEDISPDDFDFHDEYPEFKKEQEGKYGLKEKDDLENKPKI
jgi:hypothetical protein